MERLRLLPALLLLAGAFTARSQSRFDLPGPKIDIRVTRAGVLLPIAAVPNLQPGDQIWLHPDFPPSQSAHYLLIAAFLRGTTNPPPDNWFTRVETWERKVREEGVTVTVPAEAQQAILFLAPETGGDFATLRSAVKGRPGIFVRASQDLTEAGFEQGRIEKYLAALKEVPPGDAKALQMHSDLLARTLALRPNADCLKRDPSQLYTCLTQTGSQTLLDDGHALSIVDTLANGPGSDFINAASGTQLAGGGTYSAYVGAIVDLVRLTSGLHTAKYQYIPAIAFPASDGAQATLDLRLNTAPSFNNPKSVIVIGLPAVRVAAPPPLRPVDAQHVSCLLDPRLALPIEGAPLVFSTAFAHSLVLHLDASATGPRDIPLTPDAYQGGLVPKPASTDDRRELPPVVAAAAPVAVPGLPAAPPPAPRSQVEPPAPGAITAGTIEGFWGFDHFTGPTVLLQQTAGTGWRILPARTGKPDSSLLIVGQPNHLQLTASGTACVQAVSLQPGDAKVDWKLEPPADDKPASQPAPRSAGGGSASRPIAVTLNLPHDASAGTISIAVQQFGEKAPDLLAATTFVEPARIDALQFHAGDTTAKLTGTSLDQVGSVTIRDVVFVPAPGSVDAGKTLPLTQNPANKPLALKPGERFSAEVHLHDGRTLPVSGDVLPSRPSVTILSRRVTNAPSSAISLAPGNDLALGSQLIFFLKSRDPFPRTGKIEVSSVPAPETASPPGSQEPALQTTLTIASGALMLQDAHTVLATFDPLKSFGPSTFGPFQLRPVAADGTPGEWISLATIVRLPTLTSLTCPVPAPVPATAAASPDANATSAATCTLAGTSLFLIDSIATDSAFTSPAKVPEGFVETSLQVPAPAPNMQPATYFLRLRDDPATVQAVTLNVQSDTPPPARPTSKSRAPRL